jgi:hypothetical protein
MKEIIASVPPLPERPPEWVSAAERRKRERAEQAAEHEQAEKAAATAAEARSHAAIEAEFEALRARIDARQRGDGLDNDQPEGIIESLTPPDANAASPEQPTAANGAEPITPAEDLSLAFVAAITERPLIGPCVVFDAVMSLLFQTIGMHNNPTSCAEIVIQRIRDQFNTHQAVIEVRDLLPVATAEPSKTNSVPDKRELRPFTASIYFIDPNSVTGAEAAFRSRGLTFVTQCTTCLLHDDGALMPSGGETVAGELIGETEFIFDVFKLEAWLREIVEPLGGVYVKCQLLDPPKPPPVKKPGRKKSARPCT